MNILEQAHLLRRLCNEQNVTSVNALSKEHRKEFDDEYNKYFNLKEDLMEITKDDIGKRFKRRDGKEEVIREVGTGDWPVSTEDGYIYSIKGRYKINFVNRESLIESKEDLVERLDDSTDKEITPKIKNTYNIFEAIKLVENKEFVKFINQYNAAQSSFKEYTTDLLYDFINTSLNAK